MKKTIPTAVVGSTMLAFGSPAPADNNECHEVSFAQMPWTGVSGKTETAAWMLDELGYETNVGTADVAIVYQSVANGKHDASFGLWLPVSRTPIRKHMLEGTINIVARNIDGARLTLAVPEYVHDAGVENHSDLDEFRDRFNGKIYGLEPGTDNNEKIKDMIANDAYGLGDWELVESSEAGLPIGFIAIGRRVIACSRAAMRSPARDGDGRGVRRGRGASPVSISGCGNGGRFRRRRARR